MDETLKKKKDKALDLFRDKDYLSALGAYKELYYDQEYKRQNKNMEWDLNTMMRCCHSLVMVGSAKEDVILEFFQYLKEYLSIAKDTDTIQLNKWNDAIIKDLLGYALDLHLELIEDMQNLKETIFKQLEEFTTAFYPIFPYQLFYGVLGVKIFEERQNYRRRARDHYQHIKNTRTLIQVYLQFTLELDEASFSRASMMNLMADLVYFYGADIGERGKNEEEAIKWLEKSLKIFPENHFTKNRLGEIQKLITTNRQIDRFRHDATSKLSFLKDRLHLLSKKASNELSQDLLELGEQVREIEGIFRLTKKEKGQFSLVDMKELMEQILSSNEISLSTDCTTFVGKEELVELDENYFSIALRNIIKNSLEAYKKNQIEMGPCPVEIVFDYCTWTCTVEDWAGGIPNHFLEGDQLFQAYVSTKGTYMNVGLGLNQVKEAIELQEGRVWVKNTDLGAIFTIELSRGDTNE